MEGPAGRRSVGVPRAATRAPQPRPWAAYRSPLSSPEDLSDSEEPFPKDITKWNSDDLMDKIESPEPEDTQGDWAVLGPPLPSPLTQLLLSAGHWGRWGGDTLGRSLRPVGLGLPTAPCSRRPPLLCCRRSVPPECPRVQGGPAEHHRGGCPSGMGPGTVQPGVPRAARGRGKEQRTGPKGTAKAELHTHSLASAPAWAPRERGLGPPL